MYTISNRMIFIITTILFGISTLYSDTLSNIPNVMQGNGDDWCWAATGKSVCGYFDKNFTKTLAQVAAIYTTNPKVYPPRDEVGTYLKRIIEENCVNPQVKASYKDAILPFSEVKVSIDKGWPVIYVVNVKTGNSYHCVVICGYNGTNVYIMEPSAGRKIWLSYGANGIPMGVGSLGSLVITATNTTNISTFMYSKPHQPKALMSRNNTHNNSIFLFFPTSLKKIEKLSIYNVRGGEVYRVFGVPPYPNAYVEIPFIFPSGNYFITLNHRSTQGILKKQHYSFQVIR